MPAIIHSRGKTRLQLKPLQKCVEALLRASRKSRAIVEVSLVGDAGIRRLNKDYRGKDRVTDVLSFPLETHPAHRGPWHLGEIVISLPAARRQAKSAGRRPLDQLIRLAVHGLAHLSGLDHEASERERVKFLRIERKWLSHLRKKRLLSWDGSLQF